PNSPLCRFLEPLLSLQWLPVQALAHCLPHHPLRRRRRQGSALLSSGRVSFLFSLSDRSVFLLIGLKQPYDHPENPYDIVGVDYIIPLRPSAAVERSHVESGIVRGCRGYTADGDVQGTQGIGQDRSCLSGACDATTD